MQRVFAVFLAAAALECTADAQPKVSAVLNAASYSAVVAPGTWVAIFGTNLASAPAGAQTVPLPTVLGGVSVTVGGLPAPLLYASATQVNALIPATVAIPADTVVPLIVTAAGTSVTYNIRLTRNAPGVFTRNGAGTGRALVFDARFAAVDTIHSGDTLILYATGLGPTDASGQATDPIDVFIGERKAEVKFAGVAPGFPGIYQLNVIAPVPATDRIFLRAGGWQSNIVDTGIAAGANTANVTGAIDALYPSKDPMFTLPPCLEDDDTPCSNGVGVSMVLQAASFSTSFDVLPSATAFDIAAVGPGGVSLISFDPASGNYSAAISTITQAAAVGDFSRSAATLWDYFSCNERAVCFPFPANIEPASRLDPVFLQATRVLPAPDSVPSDNVNGTMQASGKLTGSHVTIDAQNNAVLSRFGGFLQMPLGPFDKTVSTFKLYVDGRQIASKDLTFRVVYRAQ